MNRLCQSSHGSLEAVINMTGYFGDSQRKLVHFSRDRMTGMWLSRAVVSDHPQSGGSMIQNTSKRHCDQKHGDFEVVVLEDNELKHYTRDNTLTVHRNASAWRCSATITAAAGPKSPIVGPTCLYQISPDSLMALVPCNSGIEQHRFKSNTWTRVNTIAGMNGPSCVYTNPIAGITTFHAVVRVDYKIHVKIIEEKAWKPLELALPSSLSQIRHTPYHRVTRTTNPIAVVSPSNNMFDNSPNTEAIVFHACGPSWQDTWMILHWSLPAGTSQWVVSSVVLPHATGMPL
ncbi:hypothetical protein E0Z10_g856 [Xylaria hypoxylon]|uniref:Uncharacterized protein n=1 Tax=Xylaria hypoxylon TaxID=37992 RepID=A0A4Z0YVD7_9PEZI|nr:hypothetical protein E0Z10_g856 [Xylaria hypoxylon]